MLIQTMTGNEDWPGQGQTKVFMFVVPSNQFRFGREVHLWEAAKKRSDGMPAVTQLSTTTVPAGVGLKQDIIGKWTTSAYEVAEGAMLKLMALRKLGPTMRQANLLLRCRKDGPMTRVMIQTLPQARATLTELTIEGRFEIVEPDVAARDGVVIAPAYLPSHFRSRWSQFGWLNVRETAPEVVAEKKVLKRRILDAAGKPVEIETTHQKRALDL